MAQPVAFTPATDYSDYQTNNPGSFINGANLDTDLVAIKTTTDQIRANLALIQRDDGDIGNAVVKPDSFSAASLVLMAGSWIPRGEWLTATAYVVSDVIEDTDLPYVCVEAHTSGTFSTDLAAGKWMPLASLDASAASAAAAAASASAASTTEAAVMAAASGFKFKVNVKAATTANITLSGAQTIDGISCVAADRVLVKDQTAPAENGIYVVASGAWARATDLDVWDEFPSATVPVEQGSTQADRIYICTSDSGGTLETTAVTFTRVGAQTLTAATNGGADVTGTEISVDPNNATDTAIAVGDEILFADASDSNAVKKDTVQGFLDLVPGRLTPATAQATTSGSSIDFTSIPAGVNRITVMFSGTATNGTGNIDVLIGDSGGLETSGYIWGGVQVAATAAQGTGGSTGFGVYKPSASDVLNGIMTITRLDGNTWVAAHSIGVNGTRNAGMYGGGTKTLSAELDRLSVVSGDTFNAGSINLLYE